MAFADNRSRLLGGLVLGLLIATLACVHIWLFPGPYTTALPRLFDSARWKMAESGSDARCGMIADLEYRVGIFGKSRTELHRLLGEPEGAGDDPDFSSWHLCPSFIDIYILEVRWRGDRAVEAHVRDT